MPESGFGSFMKTQRESCGFSQRQLAYLSGVSNTEIKRIEDGQRKRPSQEVLQKLAKPLGINYEKLLQAAGYYVDSRQAAIEDLRAKMAEIEGKKETGIYPTTNEDIPVPILGAIRAGAPMYADENLEGYAYIDKYTASQGEHFFIRVKGDSMEPTIQEGSLVLIRKQSGLDQGDIAAVMVDREEAALKRVYYSNNNCILQSDNKKYLPLIYPRDEVIILGKAVEMRKRL